jgi:glycosyltransferase involved in cell wall biosynthesis
MSEPLISIVIPVFNEEKNIKKCLQSIKDQDYDGPKEIIIVDNNSSDNTVEMVRGEGVKVISENKAGVIYARETGAKAAQGQIIIQTDADTVFPTDWLSRIVKAFADNPSASAVVGSFKFFDGPWWGKAYTNLRFSFTNLIYKKTGSPDYIPGANTAFKKSCWHGYDMTLDQGGDEVALLKALKKEGQVVFLRDNAVFTSARRLDRGVLYNIFVILIVYNIFDYNFRKITGRSIVKPFPRIRKQEGDITCN